MRHVIFICAVWLAVTGASSAEASEPTPVVVELFTSQGCSSCPPADAFIGELADEKAVLPLSFHVDYWDYIGWKDPFADPDHGRRQKAYAQQFNQRSVYTPQVVVQGLYEAVGSNRRSVRQLIQRASEETSPIAILMQPQDDGLHIRLPETHPGLQADLLLVLFDRQHVTQVRRGENRGETLTNRNVVRATLALGTWDGMATEFLVAASRLPGTADAGALLLQKPNGGAILSAAWTLLAR
ncbi:DUF1223 domain-containing protein [Magnetospira thiophila]